VNTEQKRQTSTSWGFKTFLAGVTIGVVFGLVLFQIWGRGPHATIWAGFWGLVGGALAPTIVVVYRFINNKRAP